MDRKGWYASRKVMGWVDFMEEEWSVGQRAESSFFGYRFTQYL